MNLLLTSIGSSGDINPFLALGVELVRRRHQVTMLANPWFEDAVRAAGMGFEPLGEPLSPVEAAEQMPLAFSRLFGAWTIINRWFAPLAPVMMKRVDESARACHADLIVGHQISFGMPWAARRLGLPWAICVLSPGTMLSAEDPSVFPLGPDLSAAPMWRRRLDRRLASRVLSFMLDRPLNAHRRAMGLPPHRDTFFGEMFEGAAALGLWSPSFRPRAPDDPPNFEVCGFPWHDVSTRYGEAGVRLSPTLERFLDEGEPPVVFTLGSVLSHQGRREFDAAVEACRKVGCRGVLITGRRDSMPTDLPPGVIAEAYAPYSQLMSRGSATVHHGGVGTTAQSLRAGKPTIIMPFAHDQFDHAARVGRLGVGASIPRGGRLGARMARAIESVLGDRGIAHAAKALGERIASERGVEHAADRLEAIPA